MASSPSPVAASTPKNWVESFSPYAKRALVITTLVLALITYVGIILCASPIRPLFMSYNLTAFGIGTGIAGLFTLLLPAGYFLSRKKEEDKQPEEPAVVQVASPFPSPIPPQPPSPVVSVPDEEPSPVVAAPVVLEAAIPVVEATIEAPPPVVREPSPTPVINEPYEELAAAPASPSENPTSVLVRWGSNGVVLLFDKALQDWFLAKGLVQQLFPKNVFESIEEREGIYTIKLKGNNTIIPQGTKVDNKKIKQPIKGLVGKFGEIHDYANRMLSDAYVVCGSEMKIRISPGEIHFLNSEGNPKTLSDHGTAHEMNYRIYFSCATILNKIKPGVKQFLAKRVLGKKDYISVAPVLMTYYPAERIIVTRCISDFQTRIPGVTPTFQRMLSAVTQSRGGFLTAFASLKFEP